MDLSADLNHQEASSSAIRQEFEHALKETDWAHIFLILQDLIWEGLVDNALPVPPLTASPSFGQSNIHLAPGQNPAPVFDLYGQQGMPPSHPYCQADIYSQKQCNDIEKEARRNSPETAQKLKLQFAGSTFKRNCPYEVDSYVKQQPNAFLLFREVQRPHIMAELSLNNNAAINTILEQRWHQSLSAREHASYYEEAEKEKQLHMQQHPVWSPRQDNYGRSQDAEKKLKTVGSINKRKCQYKVDHQWPYVKKPPNAFMLFRKEQRPHIMAELNLNNSAAINTILGQRWKSLSAGEQARYHEEAEKERQLHLQQHPGWSCRNNYGRKRRIN
ncbi:uncharacterized protein V6R79_003586 [Siganus canaliculatus]